MTEHVYVLSGFAVPEGLDELHRLLARAGRDHPHVPQADLMMFETAVIEIAGNVVEHGGSPGTVRWAFRLDVTPDLLAAVLWDSGQPFEGDLALTSMPDPLSDSGRGLPLAKATLDELDYSRADGANHWRMLRRLARS